MPNKDEKSRWDLIGKEPEVTKEQKGEKQAETDKIPPLPEDYSEGQLEHRYKGLLDDLRETSSKDQLWNIYKSLPDDLKNAVFEIGNITWDLAFKYGFTDKASEFYKLELYVFHGILHPKEFNNKLKQVLHFVRHDTSEALFQEVDELIFNPVRESLNKLYEKAEKGQEVEKQINADGTIGIDESVKKPLAEGYASHIKKGALYVVKWFQAGFLRLYFIFTFIWCFIIGLIIFSLADKSSSRSTLADIVWGSFLLGIGGSLYMLILSAKPILRLDEKWTRAIAKDRPPWWIGLIRLFFIVLPRYFYGWVPRKVCEWYFYNYLRR